NYFLDAGLEEIVVRPGVSLVEDFELADRIYDLRQSVRRMAADGTLDDTTGRKWLRELEQRSRRGRFFSSLTAYTVLGRKPPAGEQGT
ncbi:MAG TPA: hypothetical protein PK636_08370, partial [bacterium]|nr:hypothetical protein [bacterium]